MPGALMTAGFVLFAPVAEGVGYPPIAALLAAIVLVLVPVELGVVAWAARREGVRIADVIPYQRSLSGRDWAVLVPVLILLAFVGVGVHAAIEPTLIERFFSWLPDWFVTPIDVDMISDYGATAWIVTLAAFLAVNRFVGPIVEEVYFRGYLLPRMERLGRWPRS